MTTGLPYRAVVWPRGSVSALGWPGACVWDELRVGQAREPRGAGRSATARRRGGHLGLPSSRQARLRPTPSSVDIARPLPRIAALADGRRAARVPLPSGETRATPV